MNLIQLNHAHNVNLDPHRQVYNKKTDFGVGHLGVTHERQKVF